MQGKFRNREILLIYNVQFAIIFFRALYWNLPASLIFTTLLVYVGLVLFARYGTNDPVGCVIQRRDQVKQRLPLSLDIVY